MENIYLSAIKMLLVLGAMVFGGLALYRYMGKWRVGQGSGNRGHGLSRVETIHLGYRKFVSVLEVRNRVLVIGVGEKELALLAQWEKEGGDGA
jgi:flagellar biogenesis protein FliO